MVDIDRNKRIIKILDEKSLSAVSSWAIWDEKVFEETKSKLIIHKNKLCWNDKLTSNLETKINPDYMFIALNVAERGISQKFDKYSNFHDYNSLSNDWKCALTVRNTSLIGAYMTDIIKYFPESKASVVYKSLFPTNGVVSDKNKKIYDKSMDLFQSEIDIVDPKKIIVFGEEAKKILNHSLKNGRIHLDDSVEVIGITHYASATNNSKKTLQKRFTGASDDDTTNGKFTWVTVKDFVNMNF
ncbi:hypothetical protein RZ71_04110 [Apilactobacillus kunkeei]|uniref:Uracil-DNA glycosylase-like domain-containing protein n=1 Tax=Apilactobacillus kunkeei TaxID=148814 RepID=A0A0M9DAK1_9LACO|nr:hypothetical protein [Apilactobacillus kunkeei]KOY75978.1 hypothetical protein RZ71_04110 [Apilactobacillus kunkeei]